MVVGKLVSYWVPVTFQGRTVKMRVIDSKTFRATTINQTSQTIIKSGKGNGAFLVLRSERSWIKAALLASSVASHSWETSARPARPNQRLLHWGVRRAGFSWWLSHPFWKICADVKLDHFPNFRGENKKISETFWNQPPRCSLIQLAKNKAHCGLLLHESRLSWICVPGPLNNHCFYWMFGETLIFT